jgi:hypothetical protein
MSDGASHARLRTLALAVAAPLFALALLEGLVALARVAALAASLEASDAHVRYDPELGWSGVPGYASEDHWGPGGTLHVNRQGFRGVADVPPVPVPGRIRVVCSGDSFTAGDGVGDMDTWCARLAEIDPRLEPINMGQSGYGVDQAYLWYRRDGASLAPRLHLFAVVWDDLLRVVSQRAPKPMIRLADGKLRVENVPVPRRTAASAWLARNAGLLDELRSVALLRRVARKVLASGEPPASLAAGARLSLAILTRLAKHHGRRGSLLVVVYLPTREDLSTSTFDELRAWLAEHVPERGIAYVDLTGEMKALPAERAMELFLAGRDLPRHVEGHYSAAGHRFVATRLYARLQTLSDVAALLGSTP